MSHTRGYNLKSGTRFCPIHGTRYDWSMIVCPRCAAETNEAQQMIDDAKAKIAAISATQKTGGQRVYIDSTIHANAAILDPMIEKITRNYRGMTDQQFAQLNEQEDANRAAIDDDAAMYG